MEVLELYDLTKYISATAQLAGVGRKTVERAVASKATGNALAPIGRSKMTDPYLDKVAEWITRSSGKVRADIAHEKLVAMG